jgi:predicted molibdopterin-dependent oxidoreductase YjgC
MKIQKTFCRICEAQCGLVVNTDNEKIISIEPNPDHVGSKGYACMKGLKMVTSLIVLTASLHR